MTDRVGSGLPGNTAKEGLSRHRFDDYRTRSLRDATIAPKPIL